VVSFKKETRLSCSFLTEHIRIRYLTINSFRLHPDVVQGNRNALSSDEEYGLVHEMARAISAKDRIKFATIRYSMERIRISFPFEEFVKILFTNLKKIGSVPIISVIAG
jgi:hypothetical protein